MTATIAETVITDRRRELRVKIKSLAVEARIIRTEERRCRDSLSRTVGHDEQRAALASSFASLRSHRTTDVRNEARCSLLAYALIRGRSLRTTEPKSDVSKIDWTKVSDLVGRFAVPWGRMPKDKADRLVADWLAP